jgi:hypothetical protein
MLDCTSAPFVRRARKLELSSDVATLVARNANEGTVGCGGVCVEQEYGFSSSKDFSYLVYFIEDFFYTSCTFNANCKHMLQ